MRTVHMIRTAAPLFVAALFAGAALPASAQQAASNAETTVAERTGDAGWAPLQGCWIPVGAPAEEGLLCVRPAADGPGLELLAVADGEATVSGTIVADGQPRPVSQEGCEGTEQAELSSDRSRLYLRSELVCEGGVQRTSTGVISFPSPGQWLDVEAVEVDGQSAAWVQWYREAPDEAVREAGMEHLTADRAMAIRSARIAASRPLTADDVMEASRKVDAEAVRTLVAQRAEPFDLDAETLIALADAGVPEDVIDVMVAVTYPETFALGDEAAEAQPRPSDRMARQIYMDPYYSPYSYRYRRGLYAPWGYWGGHYPGYGGYRPTVVVVEPRSTGHGRVVNGRGYSRGTASSTGSAQPRDRASAPRRSGSTGGSVSPAGARSGSGSASSGSSTGRKAKPRGGGGGEEGGSGGGSGG